MSNMQRSIRAFALGAGAVVATTIASRINSRRSAGIEYSVACERFGVAVRSAIDTDRALDSRMDLLPSCFRSEHVQAESLECKLVSTIFSNSARTKELLEPSSALLHSYAKELDQLAGEYDQIRTASIALCERVEVINRNMAGELWKLYTACYDDLQNNIWSELIKSKWNTCPSFKGYLEDRYHEALLESEGVKMALRQEQEVYAIEHMYPLQEMLFRIHEEMDPFIDVDCVRKL